MTKQRWPEGVKTSLGHHMDPSREEEVKWMKIGNHSPRPAAEYHHQNHPYESLQFYNWRMWDPAALKPKGTQFKAQARLPAQVYPQRGYLWYTEWQLIRRIESKVKRILKLAKNIKGDKDNNKAGTSNKKPELVHLIEDFHKQYESLYSLYEDLRIHVKNNIVNNANSGDEDSSCPPSDSESYYSPAESNLKNSEPNETFNPDVSNQEHETSDLDDTILKDKLTSSSEVKKLSTPHSPEFSEVVKDLTIRDQESAQKNELEGQVASLQAEIASKSNEAVQMKEKISTLEDQLQHKCKENEHFQIEVDNLNHKIRELEEKFAFDTKGRMDQVNSMKHELMSVNDEKAELELELKKKSAETSECLFQIENLRNELTNHALIEQGRMQEKESLRGQVHSLSSTKSDLEEQIIKISDEAYTWKGEKRELQDKIKKLQSSLSQSKDELSGQKRSYKELEKVKDECLEINSQLEKTNIELTNKIAQQQKTQLELEEAMGKLRIENEKAQNHCKANFHHVERKIEEMAEEFRKQYEDKCRIMSRRIRVAEQLHVEHKEWYVKNREAYEAGLKSVRDVSVTANDVLVSLDAVGLKFEECAANFLNRISKSSCELKFAKDWVMRKNKAMVLVEKDTDCLLAQLNEKEAEILVYREKVWKSENKIRELEKIIKEDEEAMLGMQEEKREAIRQLCVWIDYHRSRSDYYKKQLSEKGPGRRKAS